MAKTALTAALVVSLAAPAQAHTPAEIDAWLAEWESRLPVGGLSLGDPMVAELDDFINRHLDHFHPAPPTTPRRSYPSGVEQWRSLVETYFPAGQVDTAMCVLKAESQGEPSAKNPRSTARGLFQILGSLWAPHFGVSQDDLYDPELNVRLAAKILSVQGWGAWTTYRLCH